jgi:hypothetical protein
MKYIDKNILEKTKWIFDERLPNYIVSYCDICQQQTIHYFFQEYENRILFRCSNHKEK